MADRRTAHRPPRQRPEPVPFGGSPRGARTPARRVAWHVFRAELRACLRDRRALVTAVVLPVVLYPLIFFGNTWLERVSRETMAARKVTVALDLAGSPPELGEELRRLLAEEPPIELVEFDATRLREQLRAQQEDGGAAADAELRLGRELLHEQGRELLISSVPHAVLADRAVFRVHYDGADDLSQEAQRRAKKALRELELRESARRRSEVLGSTDPGRGLDPVAVDIASQEEQGGAALGKLLPLIAVLVLVSGGAYGALSAFAGERENHTLETLLVQPVPAVALAWGKFSAVVLLAVAALLSNAGSLVGSLAAGLGTLPGMQQAGARGVGLALEAGRLAAGALVFLPAAVLICAILCLISARARSFREGQHAIFPLTVVAALPAAAAGLADIELDALTALVPILGQGLSLRDAVAGKLATAPAALAFASGGAWSWLVIRRLAGTLDAERILQGEDTEREIALRGVQSRTAVAWGIAAVLLIYVVGGWLQSWRPLPGLMLTLWLLAPALALLAARGTARRAGTGLAEALSLRRPSLRHLAAAFLLAPALAWLMREWIPWQQRLLPMPSSQLEGASPLEAFTNLAPWALFVVLALSPGVCEELLFRGAIQGGLARDLSPRRIVLWQALLFGFAHASVYRFVPTAALGGVLALVVLRSGSLFPSMLLHVTYNAMLVLSESAPWLGDPRLPWLGLLGVALWGLPGPRVGTPRPSGAPPGGS